MTSSPSAIPSLDAIVRSALQRSWWLLLLRGLAAIAFGVLTFVWPQVTLVSLIYLYGLYALFDGVVAIAAAFRGGGIVPRWWLALSGVISVIAGLLVFVWPGLTALVLIALIAAWSIVRGAVEIVGAIRLRKEITNEWSLIAAGALSVLLGVILLIAPGSGALGLLWVIATWAIVFGGLLIFLAFKVKKLAKA